MPVDPAIRDHQAWLGYLQPEGLVVSATALVDAQVVIDRTAASPLQQKFLTFVDDIRQGDEEVPAVTSLLLLLRQFLEWPDDRLYGLTPERPIPESLKIPVSNFGETLEPTIAVEERRPGNQNEQGAWLLLVQDLPPGTDLDQPIESKLAGWAASPSKRFERLLREAGIPIGLLSSGTHLRILYAPRGENSGTLTFPVAAMAEIAGRPILAAFHLLLSRYRLFAAPTEARLPALLKRSRDYQARVSTALAQQVLDALYELLRGFQAADDHTSGKLLEQVLASDPDEVYGGLLNVLMRLVFLLYAEDRGLMPGSDLYVRNYAVHGLFERLRADAEQYPDTMEHRYGAWAQLLAVFRAVHRGCNHTLLKTPAREGHLFDPDRYPFLEARTGETQVASDQPLRLPLVPDGTIYRVLEKLLMLEGERLSYRTLDVEQIGSVYETMMGFRLQQTAGNSIALRPAKAHGAPVPVNLDELLATDANDRAKYLSDRTDYKLTTTMASAVKAAESADDLLAALERRIARSATPQPVATGTMVLVPTDERRKSGSHYTPRTLTEPIVRTTLAPILKQLGEEPTPDQILGLKICDPAMGSGAFLVEVCRQLAERLVAAWVAHGYKPYIPPDEDELLHARRLIAQRCLYGVDRNPMAVDLAKLSLWLATLAKDHPFTFVDHSLRAGDSLVGLSKQQMSEFHWEAATARRGSRQGVTFMSNIQTRIDRATEYRRTILEAGDNMLPGMKAHKLRLADDALDVVRLIGNACLSAFFSADKRSRRQERRDALFGSLSDWVSSGMGPDRRGPIASGAAGLQFGKHPITPFHWEIEFPEVFKRDTPGFDAIVGNPPFAGKNTLINGNQESYLDWLKASHEQSHGNADLVAHFFRRAFNLLRPQGCFGLIATNTIGQGDTRSTGLRWICTHGGTIYAARKRLKWPGQAAVVVSVVHACRGEMTGPFVLDGREVPIITAYLFHAGGHDDPQATAKNAEKCFVGSYVLGMGFTFDDEATKETASSIAEMHRLIEKSPRNCDRIFPYIGGEEINDDPAHAHRRYVINFAEMSEDEARHWPDLMEVVESRVRPERERLGNKGDARRRREKWWLWGRYTPGLFAAIKGMRVVLVCGQTSKYLSFVFLPTGMVYSHKTIVVATDRFRWFTALQCRVHQEWADFQGSSMKDDPVYTPDDCFRTFPFPTDVLEPEAGDDAPTDDPRLAALEIIGREYYEFRAVLMVRNNEGLTKTYNRFHDPSETSPDILRLRELHDAMDQVVLDAYGWTDIRPTCEFLLDYEDDEDVDDEPATGRPRSRKKPWRYRWPDAVRDEVLARLLKLNAERAAEERRTGEAAAAAERQSRRKAPSAEPGTATARRRGRRGSSSPRLPGMED